MNTSNSNTVTPIYAPASQSMSRAIVTASCSDERWQLDHQFEVKRAFSCLVKPHVGDEVLYCEDWIVAILNRQCDTKQSGNKGESNQISLPNQANVQIQARAIEMFAKQKMRMACTKDVEITSVAGAISMTAKDLLQTVQQSLIQLSKSWLTRSENAETKVSKLLKTQARHQIITADKEMKMDAERINMG